MWKVKSTHAVLDWQCKSLLGSGLQVATKAEAEEWWDCWTDHNNEPHIRKVVAMFNPKGSVVKVKFM